MCGDQTKISTTDLHTSGRGLLGFVVFGAAIVTVPNDQPLDPDGKFDWLGAFLAVLGLILFNFVWK